MTFYKGICYLAIMNNLPLLQVSSIDFKKAIPVVNRTKRFIIFIPHLPGGGEPMVYPEESEFSGEWIKKKNDYGVVFFNGKDSAWQAAKGNGKEAIIINDVTEEQSGQLYNKLLKLTVNKDDLNLDKIKSLLDFASQDLGIVDFYNKQKFSIHRDMKVVKPNNAFYMEVTKKDVHKALYVPDAFSFNGPVLQKFPKGAVLVSKGKFSWGVDTNVFLRSYRALIGGRERVLGTVDDEFALNGRIKRVIS
mgnify:CR=1 FL=1